jgi:hypothetical protein
VGPLPLSATARLNGRPAAIVDDAARRFTA